MMLLAFHAQPINELKQRDKSKIESLLAYGDRLLVGLNTGSLRIFRVNEAGTPDPVTDHGSKDGAVPAEAAQSTYKPVELLREEEKFSKKPVQQLAIIKEANLLVSLSDGYVSLHDLHTYLLVERLERTKGAACFAITRNVVKDSETEVPYLISRLIVAVKKKVLHLTWQETVLSPDVGELNLESNIKSLNWITGTRFVAGMDPGFSLVDVHTQVITTVNKQAPRAVTETDAGELTGVRFGAVSSSGMGYMGMGSWVPKPMATGSAHGQVLLAKDVNTIFIDEAGRALEKRQIPWSAAPEALGYSYPYLLALQSPEKGTLQIRNPDTLSLLQVIAVPNANILHVPQPNISLAHGGKGFLVASDRIIWRMNALPYPSQLDELVENQRFDEAISLLNLLEDTLIDDKAGRIREVMILKAINLFQLQKYKAAMPLFIQAEAAPDRVIALYPSSIAGNISNIPDFEDLAEVERDSQSRPEESASYEAPVTPSKSMLSKFKLGGGVAKEAVVKEVESTPTKVSARAETDRSSVRNGKSSNSKPVADTPLKDEDLKAATHEMDSFLAQVRQEIKKYLNRDGALKQNPPALDPETGKPAFANLLPQSTFCGNDSKDLDYQSALLRSAEMVDTTLFRAYMFAKPTMAGPLFRLDNFCDPEVVQTSLYEHERYSDLVEFLHGKKLHRQALEMLRKFGSGEGESGIPEAMRGPDRTVAYLKQLPPELIDTILEFVLWPIQENPDSGMDVFLADSDNAEHLPRQQVLEFLAEIDPRLEAKYLEHIINELSDQNPHVHQHLIDVYLREITSSGTTLERKHVVKEKLETFLLKSSKYNEDKTIRELPVDEELLLESRAIVLSAMGRHKQVLAIYVFKLRDFVKAEDYCNRAYLSQQQEAAGAGNAHTSIGHERTVRPVFRHTESLDDSAAQNVFATLLGLYLRPPPPEEKRWPQALDLLGKHGARLPASSTLELMPNDLAVQDLQDYFKGRMRSATSMLRQERVVRNLEEVRKAAAERRLLLGVDDGVTLGGRNRRIRVTEEDHCKVCHKRFNANAIRVYPDNEVVHYGCVGKRTGEMGTSTRRVPSRPWG
nr:vacuolar morphogenesis protein 6 [Quercus suber]